MKLVKFRRDMRPHHAGDTLVVSDEMAEKLIALSDGEIVSSVFDQQTEPEQPLPRRRHYQTRDAK